MHKPELDYSNLYQTLLSFNKWWYNSCSISNSNSSNPISINNINNSSNSSNSIISNNSNYISINSSNPFSSKLRLQNKEPSTKCLPFSNPNTRPCFHHNILLLRAMQILDIVYHRVRYMEQCTSLILLKLLRIKILCFNPTLAKIKGSIKCKHSGVLVLDSSIKLIGREATLTRIRSDD